MNEQVKIFDGLAYRMYDKYPTKQSAETVATSFRVRKGSLYPFPWKTLARVVDLGVMSGRLRYAVYTRPGE